MNNVKSVQITMSTDLSNRFANKLLRGEEFTYSMLYGLYIKALYNTYNI